VSKKPNTAPYVVRWRNGVMDDPNPVLSWRALVAAMALTRYADVTTGKNCFPGAKQCAEKMRVSERTIRAGWAELVEAGWLELKPLPASRRPTQGALKVLRWPRRDNHLHDVHACTSGAKPMHEVPPTITGNHGSPGGLPGEAPQTLEGCSMCVRKAELDEGLCRKCFKDWYGDDRIWRAA
jgi:hypothetical protein